MAGWAWGLELYKCTQVCCLVVVVVALPFCSSSGRVAVGVVSCGLDTSCRLDTAGQGMTGQGSPPRVANNRRLTPWAYCDLGMVGVLAVRQRLLLCLC